MERSRIEQEFFVRTLLWKPEFVDNPGPVQTELEQARNVLYALFDDAEMQWENEYYDGQKAWKLLKNRVEKRLQSLEAQKNAAAPKAESKSPTAPTRTVLPIKPRTFTSAYEFIRAIDFIRTRLWNSRKDLDNNMVLEDVATFIAIFRSATENDLQALPETPDERATAMQLHQHWSHITQSAATGNRQDWLDLARMIAASMTPKDSNLSQPPHGPAEE